MADLQNQLGQKDSQIGTLNGQLKGIQEQLARNNQAGDNNKKTYDKMASDYTQVVQQNQGQAQELAKLNDKIRKLYGQIENLKDVPAPAPVDADNSQKLEEDLSLLARQNEDLKNLLKQKENASKAKAKEQGRKIASVQNTLRAHIGRKIADRLNAANLDVFVDPNTGAVILRMDNSFLFKRNSADLSKGFKTTLQKVIPLYVDELFKDKDVSNKINHINIIGHASPRHRQKYVDPHRNNIRAYNFNLDLSSDRAREIVKFIFGKEFKGFNFRPQFRQKVQAIGKSFSEPVLRRPASKPSNGCGKYDCKLSRRVEISFTIKDNKDVWENK